MGALRQVIRRQLVAPLKNVAENVRRLPLQKAIRVSRRAASEGQLGGGGRRDGGKTKRSLPFSLLQTEEGSER